jgi:glycosyltransferase involved in cell wall biosynthesis
MKKNILIIAPNDQLGGAELYLKNIASFYYKNKFTVTVLFLKKKKYNGWEDLEDKLDLIFTTKTNEKLGLVQLIKNIINLRHVNYDYVYTSHVHLTGLVGFLISLKVLKTNKFIGRESTSIFKRFRGLKLMIFKIYYLGYSSLNLLICQTDLMKVQLNESLPWMSRKINIQVIPNPLNFRDALCDEKIDERFGEFIVSAGRLIDLKGFDILIKAFKKIKINHPSLKLVILGDGTSRPKLEKLVSDLNLEFDVFLIGFVKNVYPYFKKSKLCVVSSKIEGFPNVLLQMMSQNTKVVSTLCAGGIEDINGVTLAETNDVESLVNAINKTLNRNKLDNRKVFDSYLAERTIEKFIQKIELHLNTLG